MKKPSIEFEAHPPERRRRSRDVVCCCGCCCCCCLQTLGSLVGASIVAARAAKTPKAIPSTADGTVPVVLASVNTHLGASVYWKALGGLVVITALFCGGDSSATLLWLLLGMPFIQLGASLLAAIFLACSSNPDKSAGLRQIWVITLWTILGGAIGFGSMFIVPVFLK